MKKQKLFRTLTLGAVYVAAFLVGFFSLGSYFATAFQKLNITPITPSSLPKAFTVISGSMEPAIKTGSLVFTSASQSYTEGDVITYKLNNTNVTHRIEQKKYSNGQLTYITKGDANNTADEKAVLPSNVVGKVLFSVPYLGYFTDYVKKPYGFILLVVVPGTIFIYEEIRSLLKELKKLVNEIKAKKKKIVQSLNEESRGLHKGFIAVPLVGAVFVGIGLTGSYFLSQAGSTGNTFSANIPTPTPQPVAQVLVIHEVLPDSSCSQGNNEAQWIEIYNGYSTTVNLKNFKITDGTNTIDLVSSNTNLPAKSFALLAHDSAIFGSGANKCYNPNSAITANLGGQLNIDTGLLELKDASNNKIDHVQWGTSPDSTPIQNQSIERVPIGVDVATGSSWNPIDFIVREMPTPGYGSNIVLNEIFAAPSPTTNGEWVEIYNPSSLNIDLTNWKLDEPDQSDKVLTSLETINSLSYKTWDNPSGWLNNGGETLVLKDSSGKIIDQRTFGSMASNKSEGRKTDRDNLWIICTLLSKTATNNAMCQP